MAQHIGIVACSAEGAALCYRTICLEGEQTLGTHMHPEVTMHTLPLGRYMQKIYDNGNWKGVADLMLQSAQKLSRVGAQFLICPDNTIHQAMEWVLPNSPLPWLHIAEEVRNVAKENNYQHLAVLGTRWLMEGPVYKTKLSQANINCSTPDTAARERINHVIMNELVAGKFTDESRNYFSSQINLLQSQGCDAVVLGCTEIPLLIEQKHSSLPILDSTRILARAALSKAIAEPPAVAAR